MQAIRVEPQLRPQRDACLIDDQDVCPVGMSAYLLLLLLGKGVQAPNRRSLLRRGRRARLRDI
jgi:hypothetical protein